MRTTLKCKAESIAELKPKTEFEIELVILLDKQDFTDFANDLLEDQLFITEHKDLMFTDNFNVEHCLLVTYDGADYGILVQSEGYDYARYTAWFNVDLNTMLYRSVKYPPEVHDGKSPF